MTTTTRQTLIGAPIDRIDGPKKVTGTATYAYEYTADNVAYAFPVQSRIGHGRVLSVDADAARALPGVLAVLWHENASHLEPVPERELLVLQSDEVAYRGQFIALVVAETLEAARQGAESVIVHYDEQQPDVSLSAEREDLYKPEKVNPNFETDTRLGDVEQALTTADFVLDQTYHTPAHHNNPLEPHATIALWEQDMVTLYDSNQGSHFVRDKVAQLFDLDPEHVRVVSSYIGGGFGSKGSTRPQAILALMAAREVRRPVKIALTRQQMFAVAGYRTPTIQHIRLGADKNGHLTAISHDVVEQTSTLQEFAEQTAVATRMMYAAPNRSTTHRLARLDVPTPSWMRAPGECPGMFALESAMDELAITMGLDPIELRILNEPEVDPETGNPFSIRGLVTCLKEGAQRFHWHDRHTQPGIQSQGRWLIGTGVACSTYPARRSPSGARIHLNRDGLYRVSINATDLGTGAWTVLTQIAADALDVPMDAIHLEIGDTRFPRAMLAGGSMGTSSWGTAIVEAAQQLRTQLTTAGTTILPPQGIEVSVETKPNADAKHFTMHSYGAQFAEVHVDRDTGEVRVPRLLGVFEAGRIINAKTARSQFLGGMTMGLSMALHEESVMDNHFGDYVNHDFAEYHIATNADIGAIDIAWLEADDRHVNPLGAKGIGEIGIVGTAAAIANAVYNATGIRVRDLPITLDKLLA
jgi:xanthine dehydrogenase YagR molybdenum-binding subunit